MNREGRVVIIEVPGPFPLYDPKLHGGGGAIGRLPLVVDWRAGGGGTTSRAGGAGGRGTVWVKVDPGLLHSWVLRRGRGRPAHKRNLHRYGR